MDPYLLVNVLCLAGCALPFAIVMFWFRRRQTKAYGDALLAVEGAEIVLEEMSALEIGKNNAGEQAVLGRGILLLTQDQIYFQRLLPRSEIRVKRARILRVERPDFTAGIGNAGKRLIQVHFTSPQGQEQSHTWMVEHHSAWVDALS